MLNDFLKVFPTLFLIFFFLMKGGSRQPPPPPYREPPRPSPLGGGRGSSPYRSSPAPSAVNAMTPSPGRSTSTPPRPSPVRYDMNVQPNDDSVPSSAFDGRDDQSRRSRRNLRLVNNQISFINRNSFRFFFFFFLLRRKIDRKARFFLGVVNQLWLEDINVHLSDGTSLTAFLFCFPFSPFSVLFLRVAEFVVVILSIEFNDFDYLIYI